ncbi:hypothetical protein AJ87_05735 [Rhizobium yanglingense]|nr:hypothetical protein AJ87_05735 [Rhizobium yanglingense]
MVRAADIIADHFRRMGADEDRAGIADSVEQRIRIGNRELQMLGGDAVGKRYRILQVLHQDDRTEIPPAAGGGFRTVQSLQLPLDGDFHGLAEFGVIGDQDRLGTCIMFGLGQKVSGDPVRVVILVCDYQHFRRAGDHVDADRAEDLALGGGNIGVARAGDLCDRCDRLRAVGERGNSLRTADTVDLRNTGKLGRSKYGRIDLTARCRHRNDDALDACDLCRHRIHQHRARIACCAARHVEADCLDAVQREPSPTPMASS